MCTQRRKIHLMCTLRSNLSAGVDSPGSTRGPNFMNNKNLAAICWQGFFTYSVYSWLPALCPACLNKPSESTTARKPWFCLSTNGMRLALSNQNYTIWICYLHEWTSLRIWAGTFSIKGSLPFGSVNGNLGCYLNLCLLGYSSFAQIDTYDFLIKSKNNFGYSIMDF